MKSIPSGILRVAGKDLVDEVDLSLNRFEPRMEAVSPVREEAVKVPANHVKFSFGPPTVKQAKSLPDDREIQRDVILSGLWRAVLQSLKKA